MGDNEEYSLSGFTDTLLSASYTYVFSDRPWGLMGAIDVNFPTGKEQLSEAEEEAEFGENNDLFEVDNFGEGWNIGLSSGLIRQFDQVALALQGAYIFNGEFDSTSDVSDDTLDPGEQILVLGLVEWQVSSWLNIGSIVSYTSFRPDKTDGEDSFRQGQQVVIEADISIDKDPIGIAASLQTTFAGKNEEVVDDVLQEESENSNGQDIFGSLAFTYRFSERFQIQIQGDLRYYGESDLQDEQSELPYSGKRIRYAGGSTITYVLNDHVACQGEVTAVLMEQDPDIFTENAAKYTGINLGIGLTYTL
jgi:hypothetical protein